MAVEIDCPAPPGPVGAGRLELTFIGTATVLVRAGGFTLLTDPNFLHRGERAYLGLGLWSRRRTEPALHLDQLPPLDAVVLSHHHGDHFDRRAAAGLDAAVPIVTEPHAAAKLRRQGFTRPVPLATWGSATLRRGDERLRITSVPATHAPAPLDRLLPPVMGSVLEWGRGPGDPWLRMWVSGDTLVHDRLAEIAASPLPCGRRGWPSSCTRWRPGPPGRWTSPPGRSTASLRPVDDDLALLGTVAAELDAVEAALARIDEGTWGTCTRCGGGIDGARRAGDPLAAACAACA